MDEITDVMMPDKNGAEVAMELREEGFACRDKIFPMTSDLMTCGERGLVLIYFDCEGCNHTQSSMGHNS